MKHIIIQKTDSLYHILLNRADKLNALNRQLLQELLQVFEKLENTPYCRISVIKSNCTAAFCSGVDLEELAAFKNIEEARDFAILLDKVLIGILKFTKPIIAVINGLAFGVGFAISSAADIRIITNKGKICFPAGRLGAILPPASTFMLNALVSIGVSRDLLLSGREVNAEEAIRLNLVNRLISSTAIDKTIRDEANNILRNSDTAIQMTRRITNQQLIIEIEKYNLTGAENFAYLAMTREWNNRIKNFLKK